jgi:hypothetical protein
MEESIKLEPQWPFAESQARHFSKFSSGRCVSRTGDRFARGSGETIGRSPEPHTEQQS